MLTKRCDFPIIISAKAHKMQKHKTCAEGRFSERVTPGGKNKISSKIMESKGVSR